MHILYYRKNVYGREQLYILEGGRLGPAVQALTGKLTIDQADITALEILGCTFEETLAPSPTPSL